MARTKYLAALIALGSTAACTTGQHATPPNPSLYSVNQPVVQRVDYVFDAASGGNGLSSGELERLDAWFRSLELAYGDRIAVDQGGYGDPAARADVANLAASYGMALSDYVPVTIGAVRPGMVRVIVSRASASIPGCPDWSDRHLPSFEVQTSSNYGCAVNGNLAAMVADPQDLVLGQSGSGVNDTMIASKAIRVYRSKQPTGTGDLKETSSKGN